MKQPTISSYEILIKEVKARVLKAQHAALQKVNTELISLYWDVGKVIFEPQAKQI